MNSREQLKKTLELIQLEKQADLEQYRQKVLLKPLTSRVRDGMTWYPVKLKSNHIGTGERIIIEIERHGLHDQPHAFQSGKVVNVFSNAQNKPDRDSQTGVVNYVQENLMVITLNGEDIPDWMDALGVAELGEKKWATEIAAQNQPAKVIMRTNTLKTTKEKLRALLMDLNIETEYLPDQPDALVLKERANVFLTDAFKDGFFEVQDASSQLVAAFLDVAPGMRVVDTCAGAGGKTLHMASLMENKGQLIAMDLYESKLKQLKLRAKRNGAFNIEYRIIDSTKVIKKLHEKADRVLIDAPCSGLGVLKRNPDAKWKLQPEFIDNIKKVQAEVLENYSKIVKPGGKLVYATCSILPSENENQIKNFLKTEIGKEFTFVKDVKILASESGFDGFYMAKLERKLATTPSN
jgi:16S rRNA (cytosine(967)-C(5))-methyltransferase